MSTRIQPFARYRLLKPMLWFKYINGAEFSCNIEQGSICEYFQHSNTYTFAPREGVTPFFSRDTVENNPTWFAPFAAEKDAVLIVRAEFMNADSAGIYRMLEMSGAGNRYDDIAVSDLLRKMADFVRKVKPPEKEG
jgi:hypothetical protein